MTASFSRTAALLAAIGSLLAAAPAHAEGPSPFTLPPPAPQAAPTPAPAPQPYPGGWAPYAAPPYGYAAPAWGSGTPVVTERNSTGMMAGGITLIIAGSVGSIIGAALLAVGTSDRGEEWTCLSDFECFPVSTSSGGGLTAGGATMVAISTAALLVGIPLLAVGMRKVPARHEAAAFVPELRVGATGGTLRWQF